MAKGRASRLLARMTTKGAAMAGAIPSIADQQEEAERQHHGGHGEIGIGRHAEHGAEQPLPVAARPSASSSASSSVSTRRGGADHQAACRAPTRRLAAASDATDAGAEAIDQHREQRQREADDAR